MHGRRSTLRRIGIPLALATVCCAAPARERRAQSDAERMGMTWGKVEHLEALGIDRVHCFAGPAVPAERGGPGCNAYRGDTPCSTALPVLCLRVDGSPRPPYPVVCGAHAMPGEFYCGWAEGRIALTARVRGDSLKSAAAADELCRRSFGPGWRMAEHHDGAYVEGMGAAAFHGPSWPTGQAHHGGWGFLADGDIDARSRFWVAIDDQAANCWGR